MYQNLAPKPEGAKLGVTKLGLWREKRSVRDQLAVKLSGSTPSNFAGSGPDTPRYEVTDATSIAG